MNDDDHGTVVPATDYRYAKNIHIMHSADGGVAAIKNVPGTTEVSYSFTGSSGVEVVGAIEDEENNRVFYLLKALVGPDRILCYNKTTNEIKQVFSDSILADVDGQGTSLGLSDSYLITGIAFVYPWLFWTDDNGAPRRIDVERGLRTFDPTYISPDSTVPESYTVPINYKDLSIIREPPRYPIEIRKLLSTDEVNIPDQTTNQIARYGFQFSYRFLYKDGSLSVLAPYSQLVPFNTTTDEDAFDTVEVKIPKRQRIPNEVDEVQLLVRDPQTNNWGIFKVYRRDVDSATIIAHNLLGGPIALTTYFYNAYGISLIQEAEGLKQFDSIPIKSKAMEIAQNRLFLGNNLEGYDPLSTLLLSAERVSNDTALPIGTASYIYVYPNTDIFDPDHYAVIVVKVQTGDPVIDGYYEISETSTYADFSNGVLPTSVFLNQYNKIGDLGDFDPFDTGLIQFYSDIWGVSPPNGPGPGPDAFIDNTYTGTQPTLYGLGNEAGLAEGDFIFKSGSRYQIGIVFYDYAGRNNGVYTNDDCIIDIPERLYTSTDFTTGITWLIDGIVNNNQIPLWATHYSIVRTKNLTTDFFLVTGFRDRYYVTLEPDGTYSYAQSAYPSNTDLYALGWELFANRDGFGYTYAAGDVLKYWPDDDSPPEYYSIIGQDGPYILTTPRDVGSLVGTGGGRVEIFTPIYNNENPVFYEVGEFYAIDNAGTVDKEFSVYSGVLRGDVYFSGTDDGVGTAFGIERMSPNKNVWQVWNTDAGRPNIVLYDSKQGRRKTAIRWSNQYVAGAKINGLHSFDEVDEIVLEEASGPIQKLITVGKSQSEGSVMLSVGTNNTYSMYLGETQLVDNSEQTLLATSGRVIGTIRDLRGGYGTNHPESVVENEGRAYWYDEQRGVVVRYAANGLTPVSDYKFRAFFNRLSSYTRSLPVIGGFDKLRTEYLLCVTPLDADDDIEWLNDYNDDLIFRDRLLVASAVTSFNITVYAGAEYTLTAEWPSSGLMTIYVDGVVVATQNYVGDFVTHEITFTPDTSGELTYLFTPKGSPPRGSGTLYGPLISPHQAWQGEGFTLGFRDIDGEEGWTAHYEFTPEWFSKSGNLLLSFRNGKLYRHDNKTAYNTFYGTEYKSGIAFVVNQPAAIVKWAGSIGVQANDTPTWIHIRTENPYIQSSDLEDEDMRLREGIYYGEIRRDRLSPNATGTYFEKSLKGDKMRSSLLEVYVEFSTFADELLVYLIKVMWQQSKGHY